MLLQRFSILAVLLTVLSSQSSGGVLKGTEAMPHLRALARKHGEQQPVIVLSSGNCSNLERALYLEMGADATWPKPYPAGEAMAADLVQWMGATNPPRIEIPDR